MVNFGGFYDIAPDQVEYIRADDNTGGTHPYTLGVCLKSGRVLSVHYTTKQARDREKEFLARAIGYGIRKDAQEVISRLCSLEYTANRIDKRTLRIWRQLKALLPVAGDEEEI